MKSTDDKTKNIIYLHLREAPPEHRPYPEPVEFYFFPFVCYIDRACYESKKPKISRFKSVSCKRYRPNNFHL